MDDYTFEDYLKDFELDYLGFDGVPDEPVSNPCPEQCDRNEPEADGTDNGTHVP